MKYKNLYLGFVFLALLGVTGTFYWQRTTGEDNNQEITAVDKSLESYVAQPRNTQNRTDNSLQVQGVQSAQNQQNSQNQLPTPNEFGIYEQYSTSETPLFIDVNIGNGREAKQGDKVAMLYKGYLTNGQLFDQSRADESGQIQPFPFQIGGGQVIQGWEATIPGMKVGGQRRLIIPSSFGYGPTGQGPIPANAALVFDVELIAIDQSSGTAPQTQFIGP
jgi:FKBP-type peptidyl-prolyl cis-trans isomerase